ncbi:MAG TPA: hypothetical protein VKV15_09845 [Bryobacteraceae bacterium]|nr:hypothetical protein [Bryobacteraceae bacterium]
MRLAFVFAWIVCLPLFGADVTGKWKGQMGQGRDVVFQLKSDGAKVSGTMSGAEGGSHSITTGESNGNGNDISFTAASEWQSNPVKLLFKGAVNGDEMKLTVSSEGGEWTSEVVAKKSAE